MLTLTIHPGKILDLESVWFIGPARHCSHYNQISENKVTGTTYHPLVSSLLDQDKV